MSEYMIQGDTLTAIGDAIRAKTGDTATMTPAQMATAIEGISTGFPNGTVWTKATTTQGAPDIVYGNGMFVCGHLYSYDGKTWHKSPSEHTPYYSLAYADGLWVGSGNTASALYSADGINWSVGSTPRHFSVVARGNDMWVGGAGATSKYGALYSADGMTWTQSNLTTERIAAITYSKGLFVAVGKDGAWWSEDGKTWTQAMTIELLSVAYADGLWVAGGNMTDVDADGNITGTGIWTSVDGKTWTQASNGFASAIAKANGLWVATPYYSSDGANWSLLDTVILPAKIVNRAGIWIAATQNGHYSVDGITWTSVTDGKGNSVADLSDVAYGNGCWVATGDQLYYSVTWEPS